MISIRFVWMPAPPEMGGEKARFRASYGNTLRLLDRELAKLDARNVIMQAGFKPEHLRNDGWPRSGVPRQHEAVVLSFTTGRGVECSFPCSTFDTFDDNVRAIAMTLEALRAIDRYGVSLGGEQYTGWAQIAAPGESEPTTREEAAIWLAAVAGVPKDYILDSAEACDEAYRKAARKMHPDSGGNHDDFVELQRCMRILTAAGGSR